MEPPNEAVRSDASRAPKGLPRTHELKQEIVFARNDYDVGLTNNWMAKQSTKQRITFCLKEACRLRHKSKKIQFGMNYNSESS